MDQESAKKAKILKDFGSNLERLIYEKFKSRDAFLKVIEMHKANLHRLINGEVDPQLTTLQKIADGLGVPVRELFPSK